MKFKTLAGRERFLSVEKNRIIWESSSLSKFQKSIKDFLRPYWEHHICYEEMPLVGTRLRLDFYNATKRIAIECDGAQHSSFNKFFHSGDRENYRSQIERDLKKSAWCEKNNIQLIIIEPQDLPLSKIFFKKNGVLL